MEFHSWRPHPWHGLSPGRNPPLELRAFIEITPFDLVKYELDKPTGHLKVDRRSPTNPLEHLLRIRPSHLPLQDPFVIQRLVPGRG